MTNALREGATPAVLSILSDTAHGEEVGFTFEREDGTHETFKVPVEAWWVRALARDMVLRLVEGRVGAERVKMGGVE